MRTRVPLRRYVAWIIEVSGIEAAAEYLLCRMELGLTDNEGRHRDGVSETVLKTMIHTLQYEMARDLQDFEQRLREAVKPTKRVVAPKGGLITSETWDRQLERINRRESQRRAGSAAARRRLEACHKKPPALATPRRLTAAERMDRSWRRRKYLTVGQ